MQIPFLIDPVVAQYRRYRSAGRKLNHRIIDNFMSEDVLDIAAHNLGLGKKKRLVLDTEDDLDVLMDYGLYEIPREGKNLVRHYAASMSNASRTERDLLAAMAQATTGLFKVEQILPSRCRLSLRELTGEKRTLSLIDVGFSQSPVANCLLFFRPIELTKFTMTPGVAFVFPSTTEREMLEKWNRWENSDRYAEFFKLSKRKGIPVTLE